MRRNNYYKGGGGYYNKGGNRGGGYYGGGRRRGGNRGYGYNQYDYYEDNYNNNKNNKFVEVEISSSSKPLEKNKKESKKEIEKEISSSPPKDGKEIEINSNNSKLKFQDDIEDDTFDETYDGNYNYDPNENYDENENYDDYDDSYNDNNYSNKNNSKSYKSNPKYDKMTFTNESGFTEMVDKTINYHKNDYISDNFVNVLMIAEKPSIARAISEALSGNKFKNHRTGKGKCLITFDGFFQGAKARFTVSAVAGHVYTSDFLRQHNKWDAIDPVELYDVPIVKLEAMKKMRMPHFIQNLSSGKDILCLWLDCDSEGENICYEVIYNCLPYLNKRNYQQIFRAKFSSLTKKDLKQAFDHICDYPDKNVSLSVDARQVIDLKIGVSFTRFLTSSIMPALSGLSESYKMLSYGPCQTPTLWFCVNRQNEIKNFRSTPYYKLYIEFEVNGFRHKMFYDKKFKKTSEFKDILDKLKKVKEIKVKEIITEQNTKTPPVGLNTATLLKIASSFLRMSPHNTMVIAESLYTKGYITYPRTETTKYASTFDFKGSLNNFSNHPDFGENVKIILKNYKNPILKGVNAGDHPPITPAKVATRNDLKADHYNLYECICNNYFASISPPVQYDNITYKFDINGIVFEEYSTKINQEGFLLFQPHKKKNFIKNFPSLLKDKSYPLVLASYDERWTEAPDYITESELIGEMEQNHIGTDASMSVHIENICQRGYVKVDEGRHLIPSKLGNALIDALGTVDPSIIHPENRAKIEDFVNQVAHGKKNYKEVLKFALELYKEKFNVIRVHYNKLLEIFGKYFKLDMNKIGKEMSSINKKNEDYKKENYHQKTEEEVDWLNVCDECHKGKMYVDYDRFDKFCVFCTSCKRKDKIIRDALRIEVAKDQKCKKCGAIYITVEVENPFLNGDTTYTGCLFCDKKLS